MADTGKKVTVNGRTNGSTRVVRNEEPIVEKQPKVNTKGRTNGNTRSRG